MSQKHPIVAVTGSSGAGTSTVKRAIEHITLVIPGGKMMYAMELILTEQILDIMKRRGHLEAHA